MPGLQSAQRAKEEQESGEHDIRPVGTRTRADRGRSGEPGAGVETSPYRRTTNVLIRYQRRTASSTSRSARSRA
jgi:hypothetical protein